MSTPLDDLWGQLPGPSDSTTEVVVNGRPGFASAFDVDTAATSSVAVAARSGAELLLARNGKVPRPAIDNARVAATFLGSLDVDGQPVPKWADLSGYYRTADNRAVQFHANFAHHAEGILERLGCEADRSSVEAAVAGWQSDDLESALIADGMIAAKLRTTDEWQHHPHHLATAHLPVLSIERIGDGPPRPRPAAERALDGVRVLDCSRVLAGPVCGQTLAAQGADVLRVGSPGLPSVPICVMSTGFGKRNAFADLTTSEGRSTFDDLLAEADIWVDAFRPGALSAHGFTAERAAERSPGICVVQLCAFDWVGPWADRRGFDSIVQSTTGLVDAGARASGREMPEAPTPLPVQALDYATGFIAAAAADRKSVV